jgi:HEPN domain-containing protein
VRRRALRKAAFLQAHLERRADARALFKARRCGGAVYMAGYVIECMLKAAILGRTGLLRLEAKHQHHDLWRLIEAAGLRSTLERFHDVRRTLGLLLMGWDVSIRYEGRRWTREDALRVVEATEYLRDWLLRRL